MAIVVAQTLPNLSAGSNFASQPTQAVEERPNQELGPRSFDSFAEAVDPFLSSSRKDPFIYEMPLNEIFLQQVFGILFAVDTIVQKDPRSYYVQISKELYRWRKEEPAAKESLLGVLHELVQNIDASLQKKKKEKGTFAPVAHQRENLMVWVEMIRNCSYAELLLTPKEIKRMYLGKLEDTLDHPVLKKANFTRAGYDNYLNLLRFGELFWSTNCMVHHFMENPLLFSKIKDVSKDLQSKDPASLWNIYLNKRLNEELKFGEEETRLIVKVIRNHYQKFLDHYRNVINLTERRNILTYKWYYATPIDGFALPYLGDHQWIIEEDGEEILGKFAMIRDFSKVINQEIDALLESYDYVYQMFFFLESSRLQELAAEERKGEIEKAFEDHLTAYIVEKKQQGRRIENLTEDIRIIKKFKEADRFPQFFQIQKDVLIPFALQIKDLKAVCKVTIESSLERFGDIEKLQALVQKTEELPQKEKDLEQEKVAGPSRNPGKVSEKLQKRSVQELATSPRPSLKTPPITSKEEVAVVAKQEIKKPKIKVLIPEIVPLSMVEILENIERKICHKLGKIGEGNELARERIGNTKLHLMNVGIHLYTLENRQSMSPREFYTLLTGLVLEMDLCIEQMMMAYILYNRGVTEVQDVSPFKTHRLTELLSECGGEIRDTWDGFLSEIDGMGVFLRDVGILGAKTLSPYKGMIRGLYESMRKGDLNDPREIDGSFSSLARDFYVFCDDLSSYFAPTLPRYSIETEINDWRSHERRIEMTAEETGNYSYKYLFHDVRALLHSIDFQEKKRVENILGNTLPRLEQALCYLQEKRPRRVFLDYSTIFFLNQVIAEQVFEICHLAKFGKVDSGFYDHNLELMVKELGEEFSWTSEEVEFLQKMKDVLKSTRYPRSCEKRLQSGLLQRVFTVLRSSKNLDSIEDGFLIVTQAKSFDYDELVMQIAKDAVVLEGILKKVLEKSATYVKNEVAPA